jgi:hypothetical protein
MTATITDVASSLAAAAATRRVIASSWLPGSSATDRRAWPVRSASARPGRWASS